MPADPPSDDLFDCEGKGKPLPNPARFILELSKDAQGIKAKCLGFQLHVGRKCGRLSGRSSASRRQPPSRVTTAQQSHVCLKRKRSRASSPTFGGGSRWQQRTPSLRPRVGQQSHQAGRRKELHAEAEDGVLAEADAFDVQLVQELARARRAGVGDAGGYAKGGYG